MWTGVRGARARFFFPSRSGTTKRWTVRAKKQTANGRFFDMIIAYPPYFLGHEPNATLRHRLVRHLGPHVLAAHDAG